MDGCRNIERGREERERARAGEGTTTCSIRLARFGSFVVACGGLCGPECSTLKEGATGDSPKRLRELPPLSKLDAVRQSFSHD